MNKLNLSNVGNLFKSVCLAQDYPILLDLLWVGVSIKSFNELVVG